MFNRVPWHCQHCLTVAPPLLQGDRRTDRRMPDNCIDAALHHMRAVAIGADFHRAMVATAPEERFLIARHVQAFSLLWRQSCRGHDGSHTCRHSLYFQERYLVNEVGLSVKIKLVRSRNSFVLMSPGEYKVTVESAVMYVRKVKCFWLTSRRWKTLLHNTPYIARFVRLWQFRMCFETWVTKNSSLVSFRHVWSSVWAGG